MNNNDPQNHGRHIGDIVRSAVQSGDLSRLKDLGPAIQAAVKIAPEGGAQGDVQPAGQPEQQPGYQQQAYQRPAWQGQMTQRTPQYPRQVPGATSGILSIVFGSVGAALLGTFGITLATLALVGVSSVFSGIFSGVFFAGMAACIGAVAGGIGTRRRSTRIKQYYTVLSQKNVRTFEELAVATGQSTEQIRKDIRKVKQKGYATDLRIDQWDTCVMLGDEAYATYMAAEAARRQREEEQQQLEQRLQDPETAAMERFKSEGRSTIAEIRAANDALPAEDVSRQLDTLELTCGKIFAYVEKHPDKLPDTRRFMDYYLPTTLKMLKKYQQYEAMDLPLKTIAEAKREIENALDTINLAFANLLESLYHDDTLDVSTDIEVLRTMLEQEGLTGRKFEVEAEQEDGTTLKL